MKRRRLAILAAIVAVHLGVLALLVRQGMVPLPPVERAVELFDIAAPAPPPEPPPPEPDMLTDPTPDPPDPEVAQAPAAEAAKPAPVQTAKAPAPTPVTAAPAPSDDGTDVAAGADTLGSGSGAGGEGEGLGAGTAGSGSGGGGGDPETRARRIAGAIGFQDYPRQARREKRGGSTIAHFDVTADGRVENCRIVRSSGHADLDSETCRLILARFRYAPARDAKGRAVPDIMGWRQDWFFGR